MLKQLTYRILAWFTDFAIIISYALLLWLFTMLLIGNANLQQIEANPIVGQLVGFVTLTLAVFLYSYLTEKSIWKGTIGKKLLKLSVVVEKESNRPNILLRNILKYLPWEVAHIGVHWIYFYESMGMETPLWVWITLIVPQLIVLGYFVSIIFSKGRSSIYDRIAGTKVVLKV